SVALASAPGWWLMPARMPASVFSPSLAAGSLAMASSLALSAADTLCCMAWIAWAMVFVAALLSGLAMMAWRVAFSSALGKWFSLMRMPAMVCTLSSPALARGANRAMRITARLWRKRGRFMVRFLGLLLLLAGAGGGRVAPGKTAGPDLQGSPVPT